MDNNFVISENGGKIPKRYTLSYEKYGGEATENLFLVYYVLLLDLHSDDSIKENALKNLYELLQKNNNYNTISSNLIKKIDSNLGVKLFDSDSYERILCQMTLTRMVDNFLSYIKDILVEIVSHYPNILKSKDTEKLEDILQFDDMEKLREFIIEKKVKELFYKNVDDIKKYFQDRLNLDLFNDDDEFIDCIIKQRNLIVHNRGIISSEFNKLYPDSKVGSQIYYKYDELDDIMMKLGNIVVDIDSMIIKKYTKIKVTDNDII